MKRVNITTSLSVNMRASLEAFAKANKLPMSQVIEEGLGMRMGGVVAKAEDLLPDDLIESLNALAQRNDMPVGNLIELAVRRLLKADGDG